MVVAIHFEMLKYDITGRKSGYLHGTGANMVFNWDFGRCEGGKSGKV